MLPEVQNTPNKFFLLTVKSFITYFISYLGEDTATPVLNRITHLTPVIKVFFISAVVTISIIIVITNFPYR